MSDSVETDVQLREALRQANGPQGTILALVNGAINVVDRIRTSLAHASYSIGELLPSRKTTMSFSRASETAVETSAFATMVGETPEKQATIRGRAHRDRIAHDATTRNNVPRLDS